MEKVSRTIIWENNGNIIDSISFYGDEVAIKYYIIEFLQNKPNSVLQKDWSKFGKSGDCIKIIDNQF